MNQITIVRTRRKVFSRRIPEMAAERDAKNMLMWAIGLAIIAGLIYYPPARENLGAVLLILGEGFSAIKN